MHLINNLYG